MGREAPEKKEGGGGLDVRIRHKKNEKSQKWKVYTNNYPVIYFTGLNWFPWKKCLFLNPKADPWNSFRNFSQIS